MILNFQVTRDRNRRTVFPDDLSQQFRSDAAAYRGLDRDRRQPVGPGRIGGDIDNGLIFFFGNAGNRA